MYAMKSSNFAVTMTIMNVCALNNVYALHTKRHNIGSTPTTAIDLMLLSPFSSALPVLKNNRIQFSVSIKYEIYVFVKYTHNLVCARTHRHSAISSSCNNSSKSIFEQTYIVSVLYTTR